MARRFVASATLILAVCTSYCAYGSHVPAASLWFDQVTFDLPPREEERIGGPLIADETDRIKALALAELRAAFSGVSISFHESRDSLYRVAVLQALEQVPPHVRITAAAGQSRTLGPFGGRGAVSFAVLAANAIHYAPPGATRADIVTAIGRGIGRAAAHEFAHEILPDVDLHQIQDTGSYEYGNADRAEQYYGSLHWASVRPQIARKLGGKWWQPPV